MQASPVCQSHVWFGLESDRKGFLALPKYFSFVYQAYTERGIQAVFAGTLKVSAVKFKHEKYFFKNN